MSFLKYQNESPEFLNNYLKYKRYIEFCAETSVNETYYDLRTLLRRNKSWVLIRILSTDVPQSVQDLH